METLVWIEKYMSDAEHMILEGQVDEGVQMLQSLLYEEPGYAGLHNYLGWAYMYYARNEAQAALHFKMAMRFAPDYAPPYLHMGNLMSRGGAYEDAIAYFQEGMTKPNALRGVLLEGMAHAYELRGDYAHAVRTYKEAAKASAIDFEVDRMLKGVARCRRKRLAMFFSFW